MKKYILLSLTCATILGTFFPPVAQGAPQRATAVLPVSVQVIGYEQAKQICCFSHEENGWCWKMAPRLKNLDGVVYDARNESVPEEAKQCVQLPDRNIANLW